MLKFLEQVLIIIFIINSSVIFLLLGVNRMLRKVAEEALPAAAGNDISSWAGKVYEESGLS